MTQSSVCCKELGKLDIGKFFGVWRVAAGGDKPLGRLSNLDSTTFRGYFKPLFNGAFESVNLIDLRIVVLSFVSGIFSTGLSI
jgi:hypothetical protein